MALEAGPEDSVGPPRSCSEAAAAAGAGEMLTGRLLRRVRVSDGPQARTELTDSEPAGLPREARTVTSGHSDGHRDCARRGRVGLTMTTGDRAVTVEDSD